MTPAIQPRGANGWKFASTAPEISRDIRHRLGQLLGGIKSRCYSPSAVGFRNYGGRGICVCDEWLNDCAEFCRWAVANGYVPGLDIDRRNNDGPYSPDNCRFVTRRQNSFNRRRRHNKTSSRFKGVFRSERRRGPAKWRVIIQNGSNRIHGGYFDDEVAAALEYDRLAVLHFGEFCNLNFPHDSLKVNN